MAFSPTLSYLNAAHLERETILTLYNLWSLNSFIIGVDVWNGFWSSAVDGGVARRKAFEAGWAMQFIQPNPFGCFDNDGCWSTSSPRLGQVYSLLQVLELTPNDPFGEYVNWIAYPVQVPPP